MDKLIVKGCQVDMWERHHTNHIWRLMNIGHRWLGSYRGCSRGYLLFCILFWLNHCQGFLLSLFYLFILSTLLSLFLLFLLYFYYILPFLSITFNSLFKCLSLCWTFFLTKEWLTLKSANNIITIFILIIIFIIILIYNIYKLKSNYSAIIIWNWIIKIKKIRITKIKITKT